MHEFQWILMKEFLKTGNRGFWEFYQNIEMDEVAFNRKFPANEETEEIVQ